MSDFDLGENIYLIGERSILYTIIGFVEGWVVIERITVGGRIQRNIIDPIRIGKPIKTAWICFNTINETTWVTHQEPPSAETVLVKKVTYDF